VVIRLTDDDLLLEVEGDDEGSGPGDGEANTTESASDTSE